MYSLPFIFDRFLGTPGIVKIIVTLCAIAPLAICMGMALPIGIRLVEQDGPAIIPWVWAVNGACSVLGSVVAWGISLNYGFNATLWAAVGAYGAACLIMCVRKQESAANRYQAHSVSKFLSAQRGQGGRDGRNGQCGPSDSKHYLRP